MGTTTHLDLPYPEGSDLVIEGDDAIQALAEELDARLYPDESVTVAMAASGRAVSGATAVNFLGTASMGGFTVDANNEVFTYTGPGRFFMISVSVEVENGAVGGAASIDSTIYVQHNGANIIGSYDQVQATSAVLQHRSVVHTVTVPVQLGTGNGIGVAAYATPAGSLGLTSIRIYPIGPKLS